MGMCSIVLSLVALGADPLPEGATARLGSTRFRHDSHIVSMAYSPDGSLIATTGYHAIVRLWDTKTGALVREVHSTADTDGASGIVFSSDGTLLAMTNPLSIYRVEDGTLVHQWKSPEWDDEPHKAGAVALSPDGTLIAAGDGFGPGMVRVWKIDGEKPIREFEGFNNSSVGLEGLSFSPDGKLLVGTDDDGGSVRVWETATGRLRHQFWHDASPEDEEHDGVGAPAFSPDSRWLASGGQDHSVRVWNLNTGKERWWFRATGEIVSVRYSPDGKAIAATTEHKSIFVLDAATGKEITRWTAGSSRYRGAVLAFSPDGTTLATASGIAVRFWDYRTGRELRDDGMPTVAARRLWYSGDGSRLCSFGEDNRLFEWDPTDARLRRKRHFPSRFDQVIFNREANRAALWEREKPEIWLWEASTGKCRAFARHPGEIEGVAFSPNGKLLASTSGDENVCLWDVQSGERQRRWRRANWPVVHPLIGIPTRWSLSFSNDGRRLVGTSRDLQEIRLVTWGVEDGKKESSLLLATSPGYQPSVCRGTGVAAITLHSQTMTIFDLTTGKSRKCESSTESSRMTQSALSSDETFLVTVGDSRDDPMCLWQVDDGKELRRFKVPLGAVAVAVSPKGNQVAVVLTDATILLFDIAEVRLKQ